MIDWNIIYTFSKPFVNSYRITRSFSGCLNIKYKIFKFGTVPGLLGLCQRPKSPGQSRNFGTVPEAWDSPLELWDCPKNPECRHHVVYFKLRYQKAWESSGTFGLSQQPGLSRWTLGLFQRPRVSLTLGLFSISETHKPGTVPGLWDSNKSPGS